MAWFNRKLIRKHLPTSMYTARENFNQELQGIEYTKTPTTTQSKLTTAPDTIEEDLLHNH